MTSSQSVNAVFIINIININSLIKAQPAYLLISLSTDQAIRNKHSYIQSSRLDTVNIWKTIFSFLVLPAASVFYKSTRYIIEWKCLDDKTECKAHL